jgi:SulP family sulfate permease
MAAVGAAATVILTLLFLAPVFSYLPQAALGALVFVAAVGLVDISSLRHIFSVERRDGVLAVIAALAVIATGALYGIVGAVFISVPTLLFQLSRRPLEIVETVPTPGAAQISIPETMLLVRPRSDIFFANVQHFRRGSVCSFSRERSEAVHRAHRRLAALSLRVHRAPDRA